MYSICSGVLASDRMRAMRPRCPALHRGTTHSVRKYITLQSHGSITEIRGGRAIDGPKRRRLTQTPYNICSHRFTETPTTHAAGKRTTFFLLPLVMFVSGTKVTSTYFLAHATRSRLQLRSSLCLMFSRWLSMVLTLRLRECAMYD